jgi:hypothetical protein
MQIGAIHSISPIATAPPPVTRSGPVSAASRSATAATVTAAAGSAPSTSSASAPTSSSTTTSAPRPTGSGGGTSHGSSQSQSTSTSGAAEAALAAVYSTTVDGKTYSGSVEQSGGEYTASVANLPGATASGSSIEAAEDNLGTIIDALV